MGTQQEYWEHIEGKRIVAIEAEPMLLDNADRAPFEAISFYVEGARLHLGTNDDTDEITVSVETCGLPDRLVEIPAILEALVGKEFFWLWQAENSQGYMDTVLMSFSDTENSEADSLGPAIPQLAFVAVSGIQVLALSEAHQ